MHGGRVSPIEAETSHAVPAEVLIAAVKSHTEAATDHIAVATSNIHPNSRIYLGSNLLGSTLVHEKIDCVAHNVLLKYDFNHS